MDISVRISLHLMLSAWTQDIKTKNAKRLKSSQRNYFSFDHSFIIIIGQFYSAHLSIIQWKRGISFCSTNESTLFSNVGVAFPAHVGILSLVAGVDVATRVALGIHSCSPNAKANRRRIIRWIMFGGGSYCVTPQKRKTMDKTPSSIMRDVKRRSCRISQTLRKSEPKAGIHDKISETEGFMQREKMASFHSKPGNS